jgi:hypothetical protein
MYRFKSLSTFLSHHNYSLKSLFTVCISSQLQLEVTVHGLYLITTTAWSHHSQFLSHHNYSYKSLFTVFVRITTTAWSHYSQFLSHRTYSLKLLFTLFISPDLQFEITVHSFYLTRPKVWSHYSHCFISPDLQFEINVHIFYLITILSVTCGRSVFYSSYSGFIWPPRYIWNIAKSGATHHKQTHCIVLYVSNRCWNCS